MISPPVTCRNDLLVAVVAPNQKWFVTILGLKNYHLSFRAKHVGALHTKGTLIVQNGRADQLGLFRFLVFLTSRAVTQDMQYACQHEW